MNGAEIISSESLKILICRRMDTAHQPEFSDIPIYKMAS
jgi:hypothetical protein